MIDAFGPEEQAIQTTFERAIDMTAGNISRTLAREHQRRQQPTPQRGDPTQSTLLTEQHADGIHIAIYEIVCGGQMRGQRRMRAEVWSSRMGDDEAEFFAAREWIETDTQRLPRCRELAEQWAAAWRTGLMQAISDWEGRAECFGDAARLERLNEIADQLGRRDINGARIGIEMLIADVQADAAKGGE